MIESQDYKSKNTHGQRLRTRTCSTSVCYSLDAHADIFLCCVAVTDPSWLLRTHGCEKCSFSFMPSFTVEQVSYWNCQWSNKWCVCLLWNIDCERSHHCWFALCWRNNSHLYKHFWFILIWLARWSPWILGWHPKIQSHYGIWFVYCCFGRQNANLSAAAYWLCCSDALYH